MADKKKVEKADSNKKGTDKKKTGPASTIPKKVSNKDIRKARQAAKAKKERIPAGMDPKDYADAAFKKKVTIIMGSILLAFIIGLVVFLLITKDKYDFDGQRDEIRAELAAAGDDEAKRAAVKIELNEENHNYWITTLNASYQLPLEDPEFGYYTGATITLEGQFVKRVYSEKYIEYWVYRTHDDHEHAGEDAHDHEHEETTLGMGASVTESLDTKIPLAELNDPILIVLEDDAEIPEDGTWVRITGTLGPDCNYPLPAVYDVEMTVIENPEEH